MRLCSLIILLHRPMFAGDIAYNIRLPSPEEILELRQERVLARVNGEPVTCGLLLRACGPDLWRLLEARRQAIGTGKWGQPEERRFHEVWGTIVSETFEAIVQQELLYQRAKARRLEPSAALLERRLEERLTGIGGIEVLEAAGLTKDDLRSVVEREMLVEAVVQSEKPAGSPPGPSEVQQFYKRHRDEFTLSEPAVRLRVLALPARTRGETEAAVDAKAREKATEMLAELAGGAEFAALAHRYSVDRLTAAAGGLLRRRLACGVVTAVMPESKVSEPIQRVLPTLAPGAPAGPFESGQHLLLLLLEQRYPAGELPLPELRSEIEAYIRARHDEEATAGWLRRAFDDALITDAQGQPVPTAAFAGGRPGKNHEAPATDTGR